MTTLRLKAQVPPAVLIREAAHCAGVSTDKALAIAKQLGIRVYHNNLGRLCVSNSAAERIAAAAKADT